MPTGYTAKLYEGEEQSFPEFVMGCARAFGALITMRDAPADTPIPDSFEPNDYYQNQITQAKQELARLRSMGLEEAAQRARAEHADATARWLESQRKRERLLERYEAMLAEVLAWEPPTPDHQELKDFMAQQLRDSIDHDCDGRYDRKPELRPAAEWLADRIAVEERSLGYAEKHKAEEEERAAGRTAWVQALRGSIGVDA